MGIITPAHRTGSKGLCQHTLQNARQVGVANIITMTTHSLQESGPDAIRWQSLWCRAVFHQMGDLGNAGAWAPPGILFAFDLSEQSSPRAVPSTRVW